MIEVQIRRENTWQPLAFWKTCRSFSKFRRTINIPSHIWRPVPVEGGGLIWYRTYPLSILLNKDTPIRIEWPRRVRARGQKLERLFAVRYLLERSVQ